MKDSKRIVFLYTRLADYFYQCVLHFQKSSKENYLIDIVRYREDTNAPFVFEAAEGVRLWYKDEIPSLATFLEEDEVKAVYSAGWGDTQYLSVCKRLKQKGITTIVGLDNPWKGELRQLVGTTFFSKRIRDSFSKIWVAGRPQYEFAKRLGFATEDVLMDLYVANHELFHAQYKQKNKSEQYPKQLLFLGRLVGYKNPLLLAKIFNELDLSGQTNGWQLEFVGAGDQLDDIRAVVSANIRTRGFIKPEQLPVVLSGFGAYCLPSHNEHWGVTVHEAACAGLPLLLSYSTYAATSFLIDDYNGYAYGSTDREALKNALLKLFAMDDESLWAMSQKSYQMSKSMNQDKWCAQLNSVL